MAAMVVAAECLKIRWPTSDGLGASQPTPIMARADGKRAHEKPLAHQDGMRGAVGYSTSESDYSPHLQSVQSHFSQGQASVHVPQSQLGHWQSVHWQSAHSFSPQSGHGQVARAAASVFGHLHGSHLQSSPHLHAAKATASVFGHLHGSHLQSSPHLHAAKATASVFGHSHGSHLQLSPHLHLAAAPVAAESAGSLWSA
jgi:hypothetical protein